jgi:hypothetical protein
VVGDEIDDSSENPTLYLISNASLSLSMAVFGIVIRVASSAILRKVALNSGCQNLNVTLREIGSLLAHYAKQDGESYEFGNVS